MGDQNNDSRMRDCRRLAKLQMYVNDFMTPDNFILSKETSKETSKKTSRTYYTGPSCWLVPQAVFLRSNRFPIDHSVVISVWVSNLCFPFSHKPDILFFSFLSLVLSNSFVLIDPGDRRQLLIFYVQLFFGRGILYVHQHWARSRRLRFFSAHRCIQMRHPTPNFNP